MNERSQTQTVGSTSPPPEGFDSEPTQVKGRAVPGEPAAPTEGAPARLLGRVLLAEGLVTAQQLEQALTLQRTDGGRLGEILVTRLKALSEEDLVRGLAHQLGFEYLGELRPEDVPEDIVAKVPINFAKAHKLVPLRLEWTATTPGELSDSDATLVVAMADPLDVHALDDLRTLIGATPRPVLASSTRVLDLINKVYSRRAEGVDLDEKQDEGEGGEAEELTDLLDLTDEAPIIRWVNSLIFQAVKERASDIHVEPGEKDVVVRYRIDGVLREAKRANRNFLSSIDARVKIMAGLNIAEKRLPQDGRIRRRIAGKDIDMRVATIPTAQGERITIRLLDRTAVLLSLEDIGFSADHLATMEDLIRRPHGILLVTGPTGSGKTTTLYAALARINSPDLNILTVEDPVEYQMEGISQTQINPKIELTFAAGLRSFLRHDPDVIMVGEIRDLETAEIAIQASLTGHLVFSTVHTNDAAGGITRLVDMGVQPFLVTSSLMGLLAQRLVRRVCPSCREARRPTAEEVQQLELDPDRFFAGAIQVPHVKGDDHPPPPGHFFHANPRGCAQCGGTGYRGRSAIYELLMMDDEIRRLSLKNTDSVTIRQAAIKKGMRTLREDGAFKVLAGMTTPEEVIMVTEQNEA